jgi:cytochrome c oxidase subunit 2
MGGFALLATTGNPTENLSIFDPVSPPAEYIRHLAILVLAISGAIFIVVEGILLYCVFRFRRRPTNSAASPGDSREPPQVYGSKPIEIAWTAAPALIVFVLVLVTVRTEWEVRAGPESLPEDSRPLHVTVIGHQWWWEYVYERDGDRELGFITANELHVPARDPDAPRRSRPVFLKLVSADVCHSFWVPRLAGKTDLIPGRTNQLWFETDQLTDPDRPFLGQCAEYCGTQHANMLLRVQVDPEDVFEEWLANQRKDQSPKESDPEAVKNGRKVFLSQTCVSCHRVRGTSARGAGAPDLTHLMSRKTLAAGMIENDPEGRNLRRWIADPGKIKPGCLMAAFGLSDSDLDLVVGYLKTLK